MTGTGKGKGRYDIHIVVKTNTLSKCLNVIEQWCLELQKNGYK